MAWSHALLPLACAAAGALAAHGQPTEAATAGAELRDIRGPLPADSPPPFALTGGVLLLAGGWLLIRRATRRHQSALPPAPAATRADAYDLLARLGADFRQGACPADRLFIRLDRLIRDSIAATTGIPAQRLTSSELLAEAAACLNEAERTLLDRLLALCDRVKFADYRPDAAEVDWALNVAAVELLKPFAAERAT